MSIFSIFPSKINDKDEVYRLVRSIDKDKNISVTARGTVVRQITAEDRQRLSNIAKKYTKKQMINKT